MGFDSCGACGEELIWLWESFFFFFFFFFSLTVRLALHHKHHKNQNPQAPISAANTDPQSSKPIFVDPQAPIFATSTDPQASRPISVDPQTLISTTSTNPPIHKWPPPTLISLSLCWFVRVGVFVSLYWFVYVDVFVWVCLCVSKEKEDGERRSLRLSSFCTQRRERKKMCEIVKLIK